ncbi:NADH-quinone oxidoreductase subunit C [Thiohalorhabdus methylotrophus]|uniref:NADH-quinone oxidoreductase subunit C n=1 Tax=Thiohalorhabdus methylotrophus TaxID=3242694 RepID=A0ABV4TYJ1_9GAMM
MALNQQTIEEPLRAQFGDAIVGVEEYLGQWTVEVAPQSLQKVCLFLRDNADFAFDQLIDVCGVDYLEYYDYPADAPRFASVYHLLSLRHNHRLRLRARVLEDRPVVPTVVDIWAAATWFEREAFDMYGLIYEGHPDLRRILTDYGFAGHPFRKDFPLEGHVEMRYDPDRQRVVYQPVTIEERNLVPRTHWQEAEEDG